MSPQRILIVRPGALGDTILAIPIIHTIQRIYPNAHITFLGTRRYRDVLPGAIEFHDFDAPAWLWLFDPEAGQLRHSAPAFDLAYVILAKPDDVTRNLLRSGTRMVKQASSKPLPGTPLVPYLHKSLGLPEPSREPVLGHVPRRNREDAIWIHPGSGGPAKCIPLATMTALAAEIKALTGYGAVVTMSKEDAFLFASPGWDALVGNPTTVVLTDLPLRDLCEKMGSVRLFVGNDSGISHLAAALRIPAIVFFVRTDPAIWAPWTESHLLHLVDLRDRDLTTVDVKQAVSNMREFIRSSTHGTR